jgi:hypothetical protein
MAKHVEVAQDLRRLVAEYEPRFLAVGEESAGAAQEPGKWSYKQVLGHLIDSAANNHQRFIRMQMNRELRFPGYEQNEWVRLNRYAERPWRELVILWGAYNRHLADVMEAIAPETLENIWVEGDARYDLAFVATDYVRHLRHHIEQIERSR